MKTYKYLFSLLLVFIPLYFSSCSTKEDNHITENSSVIKPEFSANIKTTKVVRSNKKEELTLTGKVDYDPDRVIHYIPLVSGIIQRTHFSLGDKVNKGQVLAEIRSPELSSLYTEKVSVENSLRLAERNLQSVQQMHADNMMSDKELIEAETELRQAKAELERVSTSLAEFDMDSNGTFIIRAPRNGYIVNKNMSAGTPFSADSDVLFSVADLSSVWIMANVYAGNLPYVKEGMEVNIKLLSYPDETFSARITSLSQVFDPEEKVLKARIVIPNPELKLKPEMAADIRIKDETENQLWAIPSDAIVFDSDTYYAVVREKENDYSIRQIVLAGQNNGTTYVSSGLNENEEIVVKNQLLVYTALNEQ